MDKEQLIETIKKILATDQELSFLMKLSEPELETLAATIRGRIDGVTYSTAQT
jgi:hypothetical protein